MEKYLFLTPQQLAVMLYLAGGKCITGFAIKNCENVREKRQLLFNMYREGIICNLDGSFAVSPVWESMFKIMQEADRVIWISFAEQHQQDILMYVCGERSVCMENLSDEGHDLYRLFAEDTEVLKKLLVDSDMFPRIRIRKKECEMLDVRLGALSKEQVEPICTLSLYRNGFSEWRERCSIERERLIYFIRTEDAKGELRRHACKEEVEWILERYISVEVRK